MKICSY